MIAVRGVNCYVIDLWHAKRDCAVTLRSIHVILGEGAFGIHWGNSNNWARQKMSKHKVGALHFVYYVVNSQQY